MNKMVKPNLDLFGWKTWVSLIAISVQSRVMLHTYDHSEENIGDMYNCLLLVM